VLVAGQIPDLKYVCGTTNGASGNATGLTNGTTYAIGVAAYDNLGNVGVLSPMVCVTPGPIDDFFTLYNEAGGKGGGCELSSGSVDSTVVGDGAGVLLAMGALGLTIVRRRRRASQNKSQGRSGVA
jgi:hypothetical protein